MILDDEKRLFYVALTRAKKNVYILTEKSCCSECIMAIKDFINNQRQVHYDKELEEIIQNLDLF